MPDNCRHWQGLLAEHALAQRARGIGTDSGMSDALAEHLAGCAGCQAIATEFRSTSEALAYTDAPGASLVANSTPSGLTTRIAARVDHERHRRDRRDRRRRFVAAVTAVAAAILVVVLLATVRHPGSTDTPGERVALSAAGVHGDAILQARAWGTQIHLAGTGFTPGQKYNVWLEQADGTHIPAGTFTGVRNTQITVVFASALPSSEAVAIGISEPDGKLIVRAPLN